MASVRESSVCLACDPERSKVAAFMSLSRLRVPAELAAVAELVGEWYGLDASAVLWALVDERVTGLDVVDAETGDLVQSVSRP